MSTEAFTAADAFVTSLSREKSLTTIEEVMADPWIVARLNVGYRTIIVMIKNAARIPGLSCPLNETQTQLYGLGFEDHNRWSVARTDWNKVDRREVNCHLLEWYRARLRAAGFRVIGGDQSMIGRIEWGAEPTPLGANMAKWRATAWLLARYVRVVHNRYKPGGPGAKAASYEFSELSASDGAKPVVHAMELNRP